MGAGAGQIYDELFLIFLRASATPEERTQIIIRQSEKSRTGCPGPRAARRPPQAPSPGMANER